MNFIESRFIKFIIFWCILQDEEIDKTNSNNFMNKLYYDEWILVKY